MMRQQEIEQLQLSPTAAAAELARRHLADFISFTKPDYEFNWHHKLICDKLDLFAKGKIKKMFIFAPPQHGKSEPATRRLPAYLLGKNPKLRIAIISYSSTLAKAFNLDIQRIIDSTEYHHIFPDTILNESNVNTTEDSVTGYLRNTTMFETVPYRGSVRTIGVEGALTGFPVDVAIFDDLYKSREEALSKNRQETVQSFWKSVLIPRLHNNSQLLGVFTRWCEDDIAGWLLEREASEWEVIQIPAIKERNIPNDPRKIGEALWPKHLSVEKLLKIKATSPIEFNSLYQQEPKPSIDILVYPNYEIIDEMPKEYEEGYGLDFGFTNDPTAVVKVEIHNQNVYLDEQIYDTGMVNEDIKKYYERLGLKLKRLTVADSAEPKSIRELNILGMNVVGAVKGPGSIIRTVNTIRKLKLFVTRRSYNLIKELNKYQFRVYNDKISNEPIDSDNHLINAFEYYVMYKKQKVGIKL